MALAYSLVLHNPPDDKRSAAKLVCAECERSEKVVIAGIGNNPEWIEKRFKQIGWDADVHNAHRCICPKCVELRKLRRAAPAIPIAVPKPPTRVLPTLPASTAKGDEVTDIKKLSSKQKGLLRTAFESYFDPDKGKYIEDYSDHRISEELQIARVVVAEFREIFYGPIQEDPEIAAFRKMLDESQATIRNLQSTQQRMQDKLDLLLKKNGVK